MSLTATLQLQRPGFQLNVDVAAQNSEVTAIFGPSGCGKTTLLRAIAGLEPLAHGFIKVGDQVWQDDTTCLPAHQRALGFVFQDTNLFAHLNVQKNLEYGFTRIPAEQRRVSFDEATALLGIEPLLNRTVDKLSGGERQRVAIARAVLTSPGLLLMDEPLAALDETSKAEIFPYLDRLRADLDIPLLFVSHAQTEVARIADQIVLMENGSVRTCGPALETMTRLDLPLARASDAEAVIQSTVIGHDNFGLMRLQFPGGEFNAVGNITAGTSVRLRIAAKDVSLTLSQQSDTSILNIFPATVAEIADHSPARVIVKLDLSGTPLLAQITRKSADALALEKGRPVFAQIKSVAVIA